MLTRKVAIAMAPCQTVSAATLAQTFCDSEGTALLDYQIQAGRGCLTVTKLCDETSREFGHQFEAFMACWVRTLFNTFRTCSVHTVRSVQSLLYNVECHLAC